ncbi:hypothetical protein RPE78_05635 [Thioclava litoralis]|uniref:Holin-X, holin superfamily III n=1 Tax=Thioclava litoralis TaxID=3076557 RepID=A0ABZ1E4I3_9RHOB|nr:hypothetical protein RPE78_05635 [Thioclava sp. FTW29]
MQNIILAEARKVLAQARAQSSARRLDQARNRCFQLAIAACAVAGLGWAGFSIFFLNEGPQLAAAASAVITLVSIVVAWTSAACMSFTSKPKIETIR